jgi:hypothetical protein
LQLQLNATESYQIILNEPGTLGFSIKFQQAQSELPVEIFDRHGKKLSDVRLPQFSVKSEFSFLDYMLVVLFVYSFALFAIGAGVLYFCKFVRKRQQCIELRVEGQYRDDNHLPTEQGLVDPEINFLQISLQRND